MHETESVVSTHRQTHSRAMPSRAALLYGKTGGPGSSKGDEADKGKKLERSFNQEVSLMDHNLLRETFEAFDLDGSGTVDAAELRSLLAELGQHPSQAEVEEMIAEIDANNDGHLSEEEFVQLLSHRSSHRYMELLHKHSVGWSCDLEMEANAHH